MWVLVVTELFTAPFTNPQRPFQLPAPFTAYGSFRNCTRQNHGTAGNREAGGFVNSAVDIVINYFDAKKYNMDKSNIL